ncbi:hypothetical protein IWW46_003254, partial [Coemansia sp. RSA 2440]
VLDRLLNAGFFRSVEQCRNRWKFLESKYKTAAQEIESMGRTTWEFFDDMDEAKYGPKGSKGHLRRRRHSVSTHASDSTGGDRHTGQNLPASSSLFTDSQGRVQLPPIRSTPAFAAGGSGSNSAFHESPTAATRQRSTQQVFRPDPLRHSPLAFTQQSDTLRVRSISPGYMHGPANAAYSHTVSADRSSLPHNQHQTSHSGLPASFSSSFANRAAVHEHTPPPPQYHYQQHLSERAMSADESMHMRRPSSGDYRDSLRVLAARNNTVSAARQPAVQDSADAMDMRKRKLDYRADLENDTELLPAENVASMLAKAVSKNKGIELVGAVQRADVLEFLREQAALREQREAVRAEERRRADELRGAEEWRYHEFQMSMMHLIEQSLVPYAVEQSTKSSLPSASSSRANSEPKPTSHYSKGEAEDGEVADEIEMRSSSSMSSNSVNMSIKHNPANSSPGLDTLQT